MANLDDPKTQAVMEYYRVWDAGDRPGWDALLADGAWFEMPAGLPPRPLTQLWDEVRDRVSEISTTVIDGPYLGVDQAAVAVEARSVVDGETMLIKVIDLYDFDAQGKITSIRNFM